MVSEESHWQGNHIYQWWTIRHLLVYNSMITITDGAILQEEEIRTQRWEQLGAGCWILKKLGEERGLNTMKNTVVISQMIRVNTGTLQYKTLLSYEGREGI